MRQLVRSRVGVVGSVALGAALGLGPAAAAADVTLTVAAYPATVAVGGQVRLEAQFLLPPEPVTVASLTSAELGDLADAANPALVSTTCALPAVVGPDDSWGAYDFGCTYTVRLDGPAGTWTDTVTAVVRRADATEARVSATVAVQVDEGLGALAGTVTDDVTGEPLVGVPVAVEGAGGVARTASTDAAGRYGVYDLPPGEYRVSAGNGAFPEHSDYALEWYRDQGSRADADLVPVAAGATATADMELALGGRITGRVTDAETGAPLEGVDVSHAAAGTTGHLGGFPTDADGHYTIGGLSAGTYEVCVSFAAGYQELCVDGVSVRLGETAAGVDLALSQAVTPSPTPSATVSASPSPELVDTGPADGVTGLLVGGALTVLAGVLLVGVASRPRPSPRA